MVMFNLHAWLPNGTTNHCLGLLRLSSETHLNDTVTSNAPHIGRQVKGHAHPVAQPGWIVVNDCGHGLFSGLLFRFKCSKPTYVGTNSHGCLHCQISSYLKANSKTSIVYSDHSIVSLIAGFGQGFALANGIYHQMHDKCTMTGNARLLLQFPVASAPGRLYQFTDP